MTYLQRIHNFFQLDRYKTSLKTEFTAGLTTFLTMAYIIVVNPVILGSAGMDPGAVFVATCLAAALGCMLMGLLANYPIALAPSMSLNVYFAYFVVQHLGYTWQVALGAVFIAGIIFCILTFTGVRTWLIFLLPNSIKVGITAGIGLFLGVIALKNLNLVGITPHLHWQSGHLLTLEVMLSALGLLLILALEYLEVLGAILLSMLVITLAGNIFGVAHIEGIIDIPPSIAPVFAKLQIPNLLDAKILVSILIFLFVALFDNSGTLLAVLHQAKIIKPNQDVPNIKPALFADSVANTVGAILGTSSTGSYIESATGVRAGGRTGLTAVTVGVLFLFALMFAPLSASIPTFATAPALIFVAFLMLKNLNQIHWRDFTQSLPAYATTLCIPLSFSIATGLSVGFVIYMIMQILTGNVKKIPMGLWGLSLLSILYLVLQLI